MFSTEKQNIYPHAKIHYFSTILVSYLIKYDHLGYSLNTQLKGDTDSIRPVYSEALQKIC